MLLAAGVGQALIATAVGLVVGITAMVFYSMFRGKVASLISDLESATSHILSIITYQHSRRQERTRVLEGDEI
jgi:biopolymer transport protein ExbB